MNTNTNTNKPVKITTWGEYAKHRRENPDHGWCDKCDCCPVCGCCECKKHPADCPCADCEKANPLCQDCRKRPKYDDGVCEKCYAVRLGCDDEEEEEEEEDSDWDGDLDDTPNCHECGEDCGRSIIAHQKYKKTYFCSEECNRKYDGEDE